MQLGVQRTTPRNYRVVVFLLLSLNIFQLGIFGSSFIVHNHATFSSPSTSKGPRWRGLPSRCPARPINASLAASWGCDILTAACFDQGHVLLHSGHKTPGHPLFTPDPVVHLALEQMLLPGFPEPLGTTFFMPCAGHLPCGLDVRAATPLDPPDVRAPTVEDFDTCRVPFVFVPPYFSNFAEFFLNVVSPTQAMQHAGLVDHRTLYAPYTAGMAPPPFYQLWLEPFLSHPVQSLDALSSREHMAAGTPRCFDQALVCNMVNMYRHTLGNASRKGYGHWDLRPKLAGKQVAQYYADKFPALFTPPQDAAVEKVFHVVILTRSDWRLIMNLPQLLAACNAWVPPAATDFTRTRCTSRNTRAETFIEDVGVLQHTHALVMTHGAAGAFVFTMPDGAGLVEVMGWDFCGSWSRQYFEERMEADPSRPLGYFRLSADAAHLTPGAFEANRTGSRVAWKRDRNLIIDFPVLARALTKIALGEVPTSPTNRRSRFFEMGEFKACPYETTAQFPGLTPEQAANSGKTGGENFRKGGGVAVEKATAGNGTA